MIDFLKSKVFWLNILLAIVLAILIVWATFFFMGSYTHHGESIPVPNIIGTKVGDLDDFFKNKPLNYKIIDSTYIKDKPAYTVLDQQPSPQSKVKEGRRIYLTINSKIPPLTIMPSVVDASLNNAKTQLINAGLEIGEIISKPYLAKDVVLEAIINGNQLDPGSEIRKGTKVNLIIGDGIGNRIIPVPDLRGLTYEQALITMQGLGLFIGSIIQAEDVSEIEKSYVYRQSPIFDNGLNTINEGETVDIWIQRNPIVNPNDLFNNYESSTDNQSAPINNEAEKSDDESNFF